MAEKSQTTWLYRCPHCGKRLRGRAETAGKRARCPGCRQVHAIPRRMVPASTSEKPLSLRGLADRADRREAARAGADQRRVSCRCSACGYRLRIRSHLVNQEVLCPGCGQIAVAHPIAARSSKSDAYQQIRRRRVEAERRKLLGRVMRGVLDTLEQREAEARRKAEQERRRREEEARRREEESWFRIEQEMRLAAEEERRRREEQARRKAEEEQRRREAEARRRAEEKRRQQEQARRAAEAERRRREEEARRKAEAERRRREEQARQKAEEQRRRIAEEARRKAEQERQRRLAEARRKAEEQRQRREREAVLVSRMDQSAEAVHRQRAQIRQWSRAERHTAVMPAPRPGGNDGTSAGTSPDRAKALLRAEVDRWIVECSVHAEQLQQLRDGAVLRNRLGCNLDEFLRRPTGSEWLGTPFTLVPLVSNPWRYIAASADATPKQAEQWSRALLRRYRRDRRETLERFIGVGYERLAGAVAGRRISELLGELADPRQRLRYDVFWPHLPDVCLQVIRDERSLASDLVVKMLSDLADAADDPRLSIRVRHALAVSLWHVAMTRELAFATGQLTTALGYWEAAALAWVEVLRDPAFAEYLDEHIRRLFPADPTARPNVEQLRWDVWTGLASVHSLLATTYGHAGEHVACQRHLRAIDWWQLDERDAGEVACATVRAAFY